MKLHELKKKKFKRTPRKLACGSSDSGWASAGCGRYYWTGCGEPPRYRYVGCGHYVRDDCGGGGCG